MESEFYLQARREWDERYGDLVLGKRNRQIASADLMLLSLVLALGIVWISTRSKVVPYIVEVDKLGYGITMPTALTASNTPATVERMKCYEIAAFIRNARSVCSDPVVEQDMLNDLLAHAHGAANRFLESYFHADDFAKNPFQIMKHHRERSDRVDPSGFAEELRGPLERGRSRHERRTARDQSLGGDPRNRDLTPEFDRHRHQQSAGILCNAAQLGRAAKLRSTKMNRLTIIGALLYAASVLNACAAKPPTPPPPLEIVPQDAPEAEATPTPPSAEDLLAQQPPEVRAAIKQHEQDGSRLVFRTDQTHLHPYGERPDPVIDCEPLRSTDIQLQSGETITDVVMGDSERWRATPAASGDPRNPVPHVAIKPQAPGIRTNLAIYTTRHNRSAKS